jgi:hypothetical protein
LGQAASELNCRPRHDYRTMRIDLSKLVFPHLQRDQRRRALQELLLIGLTSLIVGGAFAVFVILFNQR